jgi:hypothetical protein
LFLQELQRSIYRGRCRAMPRAAELVQQIIRPGWRVAIQDQP